MGKHKRPHKNSEIDIITALRLVLEAGNFDPAAQDVIQRAIAEIQSLRDCVEELVIKVDTLTRQVLDQSRLEK